MRKTNIREINVTSLKSYERNPRKNDEAVNYVANSIKEFGFKVPLVIDKENNIVCGHTRLKAAKQLGLKKVPCIVADDLTDKQIKAFRLADNKVSEFAQWDNDLLDLELDELSDLDLDMGNFGFGNIETLEFRSGSPMADELEEDKSEAINDKFNVKIVFDSYKDWKNKENEFRHLVETSNANMVVGAK